MRHTSRPTWIVVPVALAGLVGMGAALGHGSPDQGKRVDSKAAVATPVEIHAPQYPFEVRRAQITGEAVIRVTIDAVGAVVSAEVVRASNAVLGGQSRQSALRWKFNAAEAARRTMELSFSFSLLPEPPATEPSPFGTVFIPPATVRVVEVGLARKAK